MHNQRAILTCHLYWCAETVQRDREAAAADSDDASVAPRKQLAPVTVIVMPDSTISFAVELTKEGAQLHGLEDVQCKVAMVSLQVFARASPC